MRRLAPVSLVLEDACASPGIDDSAASFCAACDTKYAARRDLLGCGVCGVRLAARRMSTIHMQLKWFHKYGVTEGQTIWVATGNRTRRGLLWMLASDQRHAKDVAVQMAGLK